MAKELIGQGEARILTDAFVESVNPKKLHKEGYILYLFNQWRAMWKMYQVMSRDPKTGVVEKEDMKGYIGTFGDFRESIIEIFNL